MNTAPLVVLIALGLALSACSDSDSAAPESAATKEMGPEHGDEHGHDEGEGEAAAEGRVKLSPEQLKTAGIGLAEAAAGAISESLPLYGVIAPNAERVRDVGARFPGVIRSVAKKMGDPVTQGETLATIESNESLQTYSVVAPLAGVVTARNGNPGEQSGDKVLFTIADLSTVWVELSLFPRDVAKVRVGQKVRVKRADSDVSAEGMVIYVAPFGSSKNQTLTARVLLDNAQRRWAPGLHVTAEVTLAEATVAVAVRNEAVQTLEERSVVFVQGDGGFEPRPLRLGRSDGELSEVTEGLQPGETYATRNSFVLKAELGKEGAEHGH